MGIDKKDKNLKDLFDVAMSDVEENFSPLFFSLQEMAERYTDHTEIASGGMKKIYKVLDKASDRYVALAKLHDDVAKEQYDSFIRESRLTAKLEHPNIMAVYDMGIIDDEPYFTMELKSGGSLEELLQKRQQMDQGTIVKYKLSKLLGIFLKVCDAVSFAHAKNVLHLDLKPANIQVGDFGEVLVCDWGLGKIIDDADNAETDALLFNPDLLNHMTLNGHIKGTPGYMAPEQVGGGLEKTFQTDVYSLGAILYALVTDNCPYEGNTAEKLKCTLEGELEAPSKRFPNKPIPAGLEAIILKAMEKEPRNRYETVLSLKHDVSQFISGYAPEDAGLVKQLTLFWHRNLYICFTSILFLTILLFGLLIFISQLQESRDLAQQQKAIAVKNQLKAENALALYQKGKNI